MYDKEFVLDFIITDSERQIKVPYFFYLAQETSVADTNSRSKSVEYFNEMGIGWVFFNWSAKIYKYPKAYEKVTMTTAPINFKGYFGTRGFICKNEAGEVLFETVLKLGLLDIINKTLVKPEQETLEEYYPQMESPKVDLKKMPKITDDFKCIKEKNIEIHRHNTDINRHTNNLVYIEYAEDLVPTEFYDENVISDVFISYKKESFCGDILRLSAFINENTREIICKFYKDEDLVCEVYFKGTKK